MHDTSSGRMAYLRAEKPAHPGDIRGKRQLAATLVFILFSMENEMSNETQSKLCSHLAELLKSDFIDTDPAVQAEFDRIESQLIEAIGEWEFSKMLDRILADMVRAN